MLNELSVTVSNVSGLSGQMSEQAQALPELTNTLQEVLVSVNGVLKDLAKLTPDLPGITRNIGEATTDIPVLLIQSQQVMVELEQLLRQLQSNWLLGGSRQNDPPASGRLSPRAVKP